MSVRSMSDLSCSNSRILLPFLVTTLVLCFFHHAVAEDTAQWRILTASNYTSQIRLHPRLLLIVTVPWSGESRSLMKEIALVVGRDQARFRKLKLMIIYKNMESMLADALGATHETTIIYCHDAFSYKYGGKLRVQNILSSVQYIMSFSSDELPLKSLTTPGELRDFLDSTEKAVVLFEFCGWTPRMLTMIKRMMENVFDFSSESNATLVVEKKEKSKCMNDDKLSCDDNGFTAMPWLGQFTSSINDSLIERTENLSNGAGDTCTLDEFQQFDSFIQKFVKVIESSSCPPEKTKFALVRERSLLSLFNIEEPADWMVVVSFAACSSCSKIIREVDDLRTALQAHVSPVSELEDDLADETSLPAKRPTMLLFIDRSSNSMQIRRESRDALNAFREAAQHHEMVNQIHRQAIRPGKMSIETTKASWSTLKHSKVQPSPASKRLIFKDKMSIIIMNKEGQQITPVTLASDLQGSSLHEILSYALKQKKEIKLSSLAKDAGFQLLSKDVEIEVVESLPSQFGTRCNQVLQEPSAEESLTSAIELDETHGPVVNCNGQNEEQSSCTDENNVALQSKEDSFDKSSQSDIELRHGHHSMSRGTEDIQGWNEDIRLKDIDENEYKVFGGSFFFIDGQYKLLETLTGDSKMPAIVIIDPLSQQHYVSDEQSAFSFSTLSVFINSFLVGKLSPHPQSAPAVPTPRSGPRPPFVNLNFHETDSIPQVTTRSFAELVLGNISASHSSDCSRGRNVLVLFSNSWCGFCQRMELVVREVHRAIGSYIKLKMSSSRKAKRTSICEYMEKLPLIYMMDCIQNDCSLIIKPTEQKELYPLLMLFPSEMKNKTVVYEGDIVVSDIINFLANHGSHVIDLIVGEGLQEGDPQKKNSHHEVVLKERLQSVDVKYYDNRTPAEFPVDKADLFVGCLLTATEKLLEVHPFDESKILIVRVDQGTGFQGIIINKHIKWESLEEAFEVLKNAPLSFGGPVIRRGMPLVALTHKFVEGRQVLPDVYFVDPAATHSLVGEIRAGNESVDDNWFFLGYVSWGFNQLFTEIAQGAWNISREQLDWPLFS